MPIGNDTTALPSISSSVPTIAGNMPPSVIPFSGAFVRKSQLMTPAPLTMMKPSIAKSTNTTARLSILNRANAAFCVLRLRLPYDLG